MTKFSSISKRFALFTFSFLWSVTMLLVGFQTNAQSYCTTGLYYYSCDYYSSIDDFSLSNIDQAGTGCTGGVEAADFTSLVCNLAQGESYLFSYTTNSGSWDSGNDFIAFWIDLNDDFDFDDPGELIYASQTGGIHSGIIVIPQSATLGLHRMRVRSATSPFAAGDACLVTYYGETQDYTAEISPPPPCPGISAVDVSDITLHTAKVNIACDGCSGSFVVEYGLTGFTPGTGSSAGTEGTIVTVADISSFPVTLTNLASSSDYQVYARRYCGIDGFSTNYGPINFITVYDACATLTEITCGTPVTANIPTGQGAFDSLNYAACPGKEMMYSFTPGVSGIYTITILSSDNSAVSYGIKEVSSGCNADGWNLAQIYPWDFTFYNPGTMILDTLTAGTAYYLCVDAINASSGANHTFQVDCYVPFDPCADIPIIECGVQQQVAIPPGLGAFTDYIDWYALNFGKEKIYSFTPAITGPYSLTVNSLTYNSTSYSYKDASDGCNGNNWHFISNFGYTGTYNILIGTLIAGNEYYFVADAMRLDGDDQTFQVDCYTPSEPCSSIETISCGDTVNVNIPPGTGKFAIPACPNTPFSQEFVGKEAIYQFTPETGGYAFLQMLTNPLPNWDNYLYYYFKPASEGCNSTGWTCALRCSNPGWYQIPMVLTAGVTYYIMVDAEILNGNTQSFVISCPEAYNPCSTITPLVCGVPVTDTIPAGIGAWITDCDPYFSTGKEHIYSFTADLSGTYAVLLGGGLRPIRFFIKDVADGCNEFGWECLATSYPNPNNLLFIRDPLVAGHTYYLLLDAYYTTGAIRTFQIRCVFPSDPCSTIASISCGSVNTVINEPGLGIFDPVSSYYGHFPGRETIFEYTPTVSGNHLLEVLTVAEYNYPIGYFLKPASDGCNNNNWTFIVGASGETVSGIPITLTAGISYYIMADNTTTGLTFRIICPTETYDYCSTIETIPSCGTNVSLTVPEGLGAFASANGWESAGKEKLFAFTPAETGYYGLQVTGGAGNNFGYYVKNASGGCNNNNWDMISLMSPWGGTVRMPYKFNSGTTYLILADATDTLGASQDFMILPPSTDPCMNIKNIEACGTYFRDTLSPGFNNYNLGGCGTNWQTQNSPTGPARICSFTPSANGISVMRTANLGSSDYSMRFFIKPASSGCDGNNWTCVPYVAYDYKAYFPYPLLEDTTYYLLIVNEYVGWNGWFGLLIDCPPPCEQYADNDGDGYGDDNNVIYYCWPNFGYVYDGGDCDDFNPQVYPGAPEIIDNIDNDCDGQIDECIDPPIVTCPGDIFACSGDAPFQLTEAEPQNGTFAGAGVMDGFFYPSIAGPGEHQISYCFTNELGCMNCCQFIITVYESQTIVLPSGWSGISSYIEPLNTDIVEMFDPVISNLIVMYNYSNMYFPGGGINPTELWDSHSGYVIKMNQSEELIICGTSIENPTIGLSQGWNIIPVLSDSPIDVAGMFGDIPEVDFVTEVAGNKLYWKQYGINSLVALEPGKSYLVHTTGITTATYPAGGDEGLKNPVFIKTAPWNDVIFTNMNHAFAFTEAACENVKPGDEIGVFASNGLCVGMMTFIATDPALGIIANGDDGYTTGIEGFLEGETVYFKQYNPSTGAMADLEVEYDNSAPNSGKFASNGISVINRASQSALQIGDQAFSDLRIFPNPTTGILMIEGITMPTLVKIFRPDGNIVSNLTLECAGSIDLSNQSSGIYLIQLSNQFGVTYRKVVKEQ